MDRRRKRLSSEEPGVLFAEHNRGGSQRVIEALLRRPSSTICLELARGRQEDCSVARNQGGLFMISAVRDPDARASWPCGEMHRFVHDHIVHRRWSPKQISLRLRLMNQRDPSTLVSHETI